MPTLPRPEVYLLEGITTAILVAWVLLTVVLTFVLPRAHRRGTPAPGL